MRDYQRQKNNKYILPRPVYHKTLWTIRDYYRMKEEADDILYSSGRPGQRNGSGISDPVAAKAIKRDKFLRITKAIDEVKTQIPEEYQRGVWDSILYGSRYPLNADRTTYGRWKSWFVFHVAEKLGY